MRQTLEVHQGEEGVSVWDEVWEKDQYSDFYQRQRRAWRRFELTRRRFFPAPGMTVLDLGSGGGEFLKVLSSNYPQLDLIGIDFSEIAVSRAEQLLGSSVGLICASALELPLNDNSVDHIFCFGLLEHISDACRAWREIERVMKPRSRALISLSSKYSFQQIYNFIRLALSSYPYGYQRNYTIKSFKKELPSTLSVKAVQRVHADTDQIHVLFPDFLVSIAMKAWSRYIFIEIEKGELHVG